MSNSIPSGTVHKLPKDLREALSTNEKVLAAWSDITPLARNEFICWVTSTKVAETRDRRVKRAVEDLRAGKRRPCCWIGCIHRPDKPLSPSVKGILSKQRK